MVIIKNTDFELIFLLFLSDVVTMPALAVDHTHLLTLGKPLWENNLKTNGLVKILYTHIHTYISQSSDLSKYLCHNENVLNVLDVKY